MIAFLSEMHALQVLREAKERAEREQQEVEDKQAARKAHFETLFDDYQGNYQSRRCHFIIRYFTR
jgi:hypothetical protein